MVLLPADVVAAALGVVAGEFDPQVPAPARRAWSGSTTSPAPADPRDQRWVLLAVEAQAVELGWEFSGSQNNSLTGRATERDALRFR
ncbi:hypothetical protein OG243_31460 [Streptomyces sp. NBC_01318]|uniref:hypothetical protein n=1 Tax=unclassified Streptomyces TaxID=2593676 RepID=UPI002DD806E2|nr:MULTISPECIES: hypothetical protein [unclassified Streptomyces]WSC42525.1 hypothetical protein OHA08_14380 [Streptomyces sp. NBC_01763]WSJ56536.1 hypothetical protein OG243_31460 [Streptomyces sp. NBC_01318]